MKNLIFCMIFIFALCIFSSKAQAQGVAIIKAQGVYNLANDEKWDHWINNVHDADMQANPLTLEQMTEYLAIHSNTTSGCACTPWTGNGGLCGTQPGINSTEASANPYEGMNWWIPECG